MTSVTGKRAFSFVELLIATAILSIGIVVVLQALSFTSRVAGVTYDIANASFLCESKMQEWEFIEKRGAIDKEPAEGTGSLGKFNWQYALNLNPELKLYYLSYNLTWERANRQEKISLDTYLR